MAFYRYYAKFTSNTAYAILDCPTWQATLAGTVILEKEGSPSQAVNFTLTPDRPLRWNELLFTMASYSSPPLPIFESNFIDNGKNISLLSPTYAHFGLHSPGQLRCTSKNATETFSCSLSAEARQCITAVTTVTCSCINGNMSRYTAQLKLPLSTQNVILHPNGNNIFPLSSVGTVVQLLITSNNTTWIKQIIKNLCHITNNWKNGILAPGEPNWKSVANRLQPKK